MAKDFSTVQPVNYNGQLASQPVRTKASAGNNARIVRTGIDWADYNAGTNNQRMGILVNLLGQQVANPLDVIRSVYIDNTFSDATIYVYFTDTRFTLVCAPGDVLLAPAFTNTQEAIIYGEGFFNGRVPFTTVHFSNVEVEGLYMPTDFNVQVQVSAELVYFNYTFTVGNSISFSCPIGNPNTNRLVAIAVSAGRNADNNAVLFTSATINGVAANLAIQDTVAADQNGVPVTESMAILYAVVPTGTVANVVINTALNAEHWETSVFVLEGWTQSAPLSVNSFIGNSGATAPLVFNGLSGGVAIMGNTIRTQGATLDAETWYGNNIEVDTAWFFDVPGFGPPAPVAKGSFAEMNSIRNGLISATTFANIAVGALWV